MKINNIQPSIQGWNSLHLTDGFLAQVGLLTVLTLFLMTKWESCQSCVNTQFWSI